MASRNVSSPRRTVPLQGTEAAQDRDAGNFAISRRRRFLYVCHRVPYPPDKGDRIRSWHFLEHLAQFGEVDLAFLTDEPIPAGTQHVLRDRCRRVLRAEIAGAARWVRGGISLLTGRSITEGLFYSRRFAREISDWLSETHYDAIVCYSSAMLQYVQRPGVKYRLIADLADVDSQKWFDYGRQSRWPLSWLFRWEGSRVRRLEAAAAENRVVVLVTEQEAALYRRIAPQADVRVVTNGIDLEYFAPRVAAASCSCVFVGYLNYRANVLGLMWFCEEVWPRLRDRHPTAEFQIIGRHPVPAIQKLARIEGVQVLGEVDDVRPHLAAAGAVVVPLQIARGIQNKVLEAMCMAKPVVSTSAALEGIGATAGREVIRADTPQEWVEAVSRVWSDTGWARNLGHCARQYIEMHHDWKACLAELTALAVIARDDPN